MPAPKTALLADRGVVRVAGADAAKLLGDIVTNDLDGLAEGAAAHAGLLSPQGKILFEFFVLRTGDGFLLETARATAADLVKRLTMYRLRAKVEIADVSGDFVVAARWGGATAAADPAGVVAYHDRRVPGAGERLLIAAAASGAVVANARGDDFAAHRIGLGLAEAGVDYKLGDTFPHEANFDLQHAASFTKGCYVGQEVVSRMQNKTVVRKRVVRVFAPLDPTAGVEIKVGSAVIGTVGSVAGRTGLAMVRLDRAAEALDKNEPITAGDMAVTIDPEAIARYRQSVRDRPVVDL